MKKFFVVIAASCLFVFGCNKSDLNNENTIPEEEITASQRKCAAQEVLEEQMKADPSLRQRMEALEEFTSRIIANRLLPSGIIEIPVAVNVLWKTSAQNISLAQIQSQIDVLNYDFSATNSDYNNTPSVFQGVRSGDIEVRFVLGPVTRKSTNKKSWQLNDAMKKSSQGGIDPTNPTTTLNMWVCNLTGGYLGYAQFPGGNSATDGVVVDDN